MEILFLRHADAEPVGQGDDALRVLTSKGKRQAKVAAKGLAKVAGKCGHVVTSPLSRAQQTAEIAAKAWKADIVEPLGALGIPFDRRAVTGRLKALQADGVPMVCLVGHAPDLGDYAGYLIGGRGSDRIHLSKAGAACVVLDGPPAAGAGRLEWLLTRKQLAALTR